MPITDFDKVELLLPMTGTNNGTAFTDYSLRKRTVTRFGDTKTVTAQSKFSGYGSSTYFDGTGDYLQLADDDAWHFGSGDFTIEAYIRPDTVSATGAMGGQRETGALNYAWAIGTFPASDLYFGYTTDGVTGLVFQSTHGMSANTWYHVAWCRNGANLRIFVDGSQIGATHNIGTATLFNSTKTMKIGSFNDSPSSFYAGHMQDFCITKGFAKYTANFTPPPRMTQRTLTRANTGTDSHEYDRAVLFDWNTSAYTLKTATPDANGDFVASDLIDLEYGVAFIRDGCSPVCRGPFEVDPDA
jgi:hypothetical protein